MAKSYVHELGDRLSNGSTADNLPKHVKEIAPIMYNDGSNNFNSIQSALNGKAESSHTHTTSIASDSSSGTAVALAHDTQYKLTAGGTSVLFKTPADSNTDTKVTQTVDSATTGNLPLLAKNTTATATITDTSRFAAAVSMTPSTGTVNATQFNVNSMCTLQFNTTTNALDFVFA